LEILKQLTYLHKSRIYFPVKSQENRVLRMISKRDLLFNLFIYYNTNSKKIRKLKSKKPLEVGKRAEDPMRGEHRELQQNRNKNAYTRSAKTSKS